MNPPMAKLFSVFEPLSNPMNSVEDFNLNLTATQYSPFVGADWKNGKLVMAGESYPENTFEYFAQIVEWIVQFLDKADRPLLLELHLSYLNTSSIRAMIDIFDLLQEAADDGKSVLVTWLYDGRNPRASELGSEFKEDYSFPFDIKILGS